MASYRAGKRMNLHPKTKLPLAAQITRSPKIEETFKDGLSKLRERNTQSNWRSLLTSTILEEDDSSDVGF